MLSVINLIHVNLPCLNVHVQIAPNEKVFLQILLQEVTELP